MYYFATTQENSTAKLPVIFAKFKKRACVLRENETKSGTENTSKRDNFYTGRNKESKYDERALF